MDSEGTHTKASPRLVGDIWHFELFANLSPDSKDRWQPFQVAGKDLGKSVFQTLRELPLRTAPSDTTVQELSLLEHLVWVRPSGRNLLRPAGV